MTSIHSKGHSGPELIDLLPLDDELLALAAEHEQLARVVEVRYFGAMTAEASAKALAGRTPWRIGALSS